MTLLKKLIPAPLSSAGLFALWLVLARGWSAGNFALGLILALVVPHLTASLRPTDVRVHKPFVCARFIITVAYDILASNLEVARDVVAHRWRRPRAGFVVIPLELRDPLGLAVLAMVTTVVPGTVWSELALDRGALLLHVWNINDEQTFIAHFKARYERPLREIFE